MYFRVLQHINFNNWRYVVIISATFCITGFSQGAIEVNGRVDANTLVFDEASPFWLYTNTNGRLSENTNFSLSAFAKANYTLSENHHFELGLGAFLRDGFRNEFQRSQLYASYKNKLFSITLGAKDPESFNKGLSTINNNILFTGNTRAIPGINISTTKSISLIKWLSADAQLGHYRLNDDRRTIKTNVHFKSLNLNWHIDDKTIVSTGLKHYVQWGGITQAGEQLPNDLNAFTKVFVGRGDNNNDNFNESINALGNHLGSYTLNYKRELNNNNTLSLYHHTLFEDRSGRELNNFPDGVWGVSLNSDGSKWFDNLLYEYVQTISQSGRPRETEGTNQQSGGDNYFSNGIYPSGWTYEGVTIGLPFINPIATSSNPLNNRVIAHHIALLNTLKNIHFTTKITYLQNLGTYRVPLPSREKVLLSYIQASREFDKLGKFSLFIGGDFSDDNSNNFGAGVAYLYQF